MYPRDLLSLFLLLPMILKFNVVLPFLATVKDTGIFFLLSTLLTFGRNWKHF